MSDGISFNIDKLFDGALRQLETEAEYFSRLTEHGPELGRMNETHLVRFLRAYLPPKIGIGTGFIVSGGVSPQQSPQCDIVLYDALNNAPLYKSEAWSIYPIEMVYGVIEVKTRLTKEELENAFVKCAMIRSMAREVVDGKEIGNKEYIRQIQASPNSPAKYCTLRFAVPPRYFVFGYQGWSTDAGLQNAFSDLSKRYEDAHIHGVCSLDGGRGLHIGHMAFRDGGERISAVYKNGFRQFLLQLPLSLDSIVPYDRLGMGFDLINLAHYEIKWGR